MFGPQLIANAVAGTNSMMVAFAVGKMIPTAQAFEQCQFEQCCCPPPTTDDQDFMNMWTSATNTTMCMPQDLCADYMPEYKECSAFTGRSSMYDGVNTCEAMTGMCSANGCCGADGPHGSDSLESNDSEDYSFDSCDGLYSVYNNGTTPMPQQSPMNMGEMIMDDDLDMEDEFMSFMGNMEIEGDDIDMGMCSAEGMCCSAEGMCGMEPPMNATSSFNADFDMLKAEFDNNQCGYMCQAQKMVNETFFGTPEAMEDDSEDSMDNFDEL